MAKKPVIKPSDQSLSYPVVHGKLIGITPLLAGKRQRRVLLIMKIDGRDSGVSLSAQDAVTLVEHVAELLSGSNANPVVALSGQEDGDEVRPQADRQQVIAKFVRFVRTAASKWTSTAAVPMITIWLKGLPKPLGLTQLDTMALLTSLVRSLASQRQPLAERIARALPRWIDEAEREVQFVRRIGSVTEHPAASGTVKKGLVLRQSIDQVYAEIRKAGPRSSFDLLVSDVEPELAAFVKARIELLKCRPVTPEGRRLEVLAIITAAIASLRQAHYQLWKETVIGSRLAQLDPTLASRDPLD